MGKSRIWQWFSSPFLALLLRLLSNSSCLMCLPYTFQYYLIIGSVSGDIFPENTSEGGWGPNERREISLSLITWKLWCWHSHWRRWMNLIYLPFEAQMTSWYGSVSPSCEIFFSLSFALLVKCRKAQRGCRGFWRRLICFVACRDWCISLSRQRQPHSNPDPFIIVR